MRKLSALFAACVVASVFVGCGLGTAPGTSSDPKSSSAALSPAAFTSGDAFSLLPTEASLWFDERFLDELRSPDARVSALGEETYAARVWRRRATLQRFARSWAERWKVNPAGDARAVGEALGSIAAWCFVQWVARLCSGHALEGDGGRVSAVVRGAIDLIPNVVSIPVVRDCYPREGGSR